MSQLLLTLYSRKGCCLCNGLEQKLRSIPFDRLNPPTQLLVLDIDGEGVDQMERLRYDLKVPVLVLRSFEISQSFELPRVSPRLKEEALFEWLQKTINKSLDFD